MIEVFCDDKNRDQRLKNQALEKRLVASAAQPIYAVFDPKTETLLKMWAWSQGIMDDPGLFAKYLDEAEAAYRKRQGK